MCQRERSAGMRDERFTLSKECFVLREQRSAEWLQSFQFKRTACQEERASFQNMKASCQRERKSHSFHFGRTTFRFTAVTDPF